MKITCLIPIKLNNKRLPNKNIKKINNKPLCSYIFNTVSNIKDFSNIYCFCSNEEIIKYFNNDNIKYLNRDNKFDSDNTSMNEIIREFIKKVESDIYV